MELKIDDTDWDIDIKAQLHLMSNAMKQWRTDITKDNPYGKNWDLFMFGHCLEVYPFRVSPHSNCRATSTKAKNPTLFTQTPPSCQKTNKLKQIAKS
jgi:hypothetical protein